MWRGYICNAYCKLFNNKEKLLDNDLKALDTEHSALNTEMDSIKSLIKDRMFHVKHSIMLLDI